MYRTYLTVLILLYSLTARGQQYVYDYDDNCRKAYNAYIGLQMPEGDAAIYAEIRQHPYNLMATYIADYGDFLSLLFSGDKNSYVQRKDHLEERIDILERGSHDSPWYHFCKAGLYLHWALVRIRFNDNLGAALIFRKSYLQSDENRKKHPEFTYNQLFYGLEQTVTGTIPENYKWIAVLFGLKGDVKKGIANLTEFVNTHTDEDPLKAEGIIYYLYLRFYLLSQRAEVWDYINSSKLNTHNNLLYAFLKANVALNYRKADAAVQAMTEAQSNKYYSRYPIFDYETGCALLNKLDPACIGYFERFLKNYIGKPYVKDAWQKMALYYYAKNNMAQGNYCRDRIPDAGNAATDADKQAQRFAENKIVPNTYILQARLLIDGGYYNRALEILLKMNDKGLPIQDQLEYDFRLARAYDELGNHEKALQLYQATINMGRERQEHFASRAALQMGFLYEKEGKRNEAIQHFKEALSMRDHDFQTSIDQQAKAGINRLGEK
ncbi:MAG: tetratricopeptide repeat protein [Flavipsychrobacter sp.]|nr:tetratricopeptide repeat protein [Flavipsychrobacter sp.]